MSVYFKLCPWLQDKTFGKIIHRHGGLLVLYRGRNYNPKKRPFIPLMLWRPHEPIYPRLIKTTIDGLSIDETKEMRKKGLAVPALTKLGMCLRTFLVKLLSTNYHIITRSLTYTWYLWTLAKNGYYGSLIPMVRDAFLSCELVRIDCKGLERSDYKKIGCKLRVMAVSFMPFT